MSLVVAISKKGFVDQTVRSFKTKIKGRFFYGFVVKKGGKFYGYQNLCQHLPVTLDLNDDQFFNHEQSHLQCHLHGAVYEIESGQCVAGPCVGARLNSLSIQEEPGRLVVEIPADVFKE